MKLSHRETPQKTNGPITDTEVPGLELYLTEEQEKTNGPIPEPEVHGFESYLKEPEKTNRAVPGI